ncbi:MAG TPA: cystathionine beta-lyase, partial [Bacteroidales bacterium]|nr:cystathionine beta-lyase [Bacteroidales bacterium]
VLLLSSPHNPVGRVWTAEELEKLGTICVKHKLTIISDEVHSDLTLPKFQFIPTAAVSETIANQTITIIAPSKTFNLAGLSTAVVIAQNKVLMQAYNNKLSDWHINQGNIFGTVALEAAYNRGDEWLEALLNYLQNNIDYLHNFLAERVPK